MPDSDKPRFQPSEVVSSQDYGVRENKDRSNAQANDTFVLQAKDNRSIGSNGETLAFGKKRFNADPAVQEARRDASMEAQMQVIELRADPVVKAWVAKKQYLDNIETDLKYANVAKEDAEGQVRLGRENNLPPDELEKLEQEAERLSARVAKLQADKDNLPQLRRELTQQLAASPKLQEYVRATQAAAGAQNMVDSTGMIADSSSNLYRDKEEMVANPAAGGDRNLITRSVASSKVDELLGTNVCAQEKYGVDDQGNLIGVSVQADGAGVRSEYGENEWMEKQSAFLDANYADPNIQKGLYDLEALDYVTGQIDRHQGNIFVDGPSGKVTGIDNDLAFPEVDREEMLERSTGLKDKAVAGMPKMMHVDTAQKILSVTPDQLRESLKAVTPPDGGEGLGDEEIEGAVQRLENLQNAIKNAPDGGIKVVAEFNDATYQESIATQKANNAQQDLTRDQNSTKAVKYNSTSYIGSIENEREFAQAKLDAKDNLYVKRDANSVNQAQINPEYEAYKQLSPGEKAQYEKLQKEVEKVEDKIAENRAKIEKLRNTEPNMKNNAANFLHGGVEGAIKHYQQKEIALNNELKAKIEQTKSVTAPVVAENARKAEAARLARQNAGGAPNNHGVPAPNAGGPGQNAGGGWAQPRARPNQPAGALSGSHRAGPAPPAPPPNAVPAVNPEDVPVPAVGRRSGGWAQGQVPGPQQNNASPGGHRTQPQPAVTPPPAPTPVPNVGGGSNQPAVAAQSPPVPPARSLQRQNSVREDMLSQGAVKNNPFLKQDQELKAAEKEQAGGEKVEAKKEGATHSLRNSGDFKQQPKPALNRQSSQIDLS